MNPEKQLKKIERRAIRATLHPLLNASLAVLKAGPEGVTPASFLEFLATTAHATLAYKKGSREQRRELRRIVMQPAITDAEFLHYLITYFFTAPGPSCPGLYD